MQLTGHLRKMLTVHQPMVEYQLLLDDNKVPLNALLGKTLGFNYSGDIHCIACGRKTNKSFSQGYCFPCMRSLAECDICLIKPEQCHYAEGTCRDNSWGEEHCFQDHFVYLANSSGLKVGITRQTNVPCRWMDQGATHALPIYKTSTRLISGLVEVIIKQHVNDKTHWQRMLKGRPEPIDLARHRDELYNICAKDIKKVMADNGNDSVTKLINEKPLEFNYPVTTYPAKVSSLNFDKTSDISGILLGIKGQYLIMDSGVLNIRKFSGYNITFTVK